MPPKLPLLLLLILFSPLNAWAAPRLSEILTVNTGGLKDKDGDLSSWIEIYNPGEERINLQGMYATNDPDNLTKYTFSKLFINPGSYRLLYLSGKDFFSLFNVEAHANFKVSDSDNYFALVDTDGTTIIDAFEDIEQRAGNSYGRLPDDEESLALFKTPTPLAANKDPILGVVADTKFSIDRGFYDEPFQVEITTETEGARIIYTTSGRAPSEGSIFTGPIEHVYEGPITIDKTTVLRAAAFKERFAPSNIDTQTYLFTQDVIEQDDMRTQITESAQYGPQMLEALNALPSISLAVENLNSVTGGNSGGNDVEYQTSVELLQPDGSKGFQVDAGVSRFGGYFTNFEKKNFRLYFRKRYGATKLKYPLFQGHEMGIAPAEEFDALNLRSGSHDAFDRGAYLSNRFTDDTLLEMGHIAPHGCFVHVYFNGRYWGQYHLRERWNAAMFASYFGGKEEDYDAINGNNTGSEFLPGEPFDGDGEYWDEALDLADSATPFQALQNHIDFRSYFSFQLAWLSGNSESEFQSAGSRIHGVQFKFYFKDADGYLRTPAHSLSNRGPGDIFRALRREEDPEFQIMLADTIHKHYFNGGAFTPEQNLARLQRRIDETKVSFIAESARWNFRTPQSWQTFQDNLIEDHFPPLTERMIKQFESQGWFPETLAPKINQFGGEISPGFTLTMSVGTLFNPQPGDLLYTTDETDPRLVGGDVSDSAQTYQRRNGPGVTLTETTTVKARLRSDKGDWSPLTETTFQVGKTPQPGDLVISEIHYRPSPPTEEETTAGFTSRSDFEFLELYNRSESSLSLSNTQFSGGVRADFANATLAPGDLIVIAANLEAFQFRYGPDVPVAGLFSSSQLNNGGETIRLTLHDGQSVLTVAYDDKAPWPEAADGQGKSLTLIDPTAASSADDASQWRASQVDGGTPGKLEEALPPEMKDHDGDGLPAFAEEALGTSDENRNEGQDRFTVSLQDKLWTATLAKSTTADPAQFEIETSVDLRTWAPATASLEETTPERLRWQSATLKSGIQHYVRLRISEPTK